MKKLMRLIFTGFLVFAMIFTAVPVIADSTPSEPYEYTIRVFSGDKGTFSGGGTVYTAKYKYGEEADISGLTVVLKEGQEKYHQSGFKESGKDDLTSTKFRVTKDQDFVVAYGINGTNVNYTVNFVEYGTGRVLEDPVVYMGTVGEKPVEAYLYIEGYRPRYMNLTKTLTINEADNVFTFEYIRLATNAAPEETTTAAAGGDNAGGTGTAGTGTAGTGTGTAGTGTGDNTGGGTGTGGDNNPGNTGNPGQPGESETTNPQDVDTQEIGDLDVPLAKPDDATTTTEETTESEPQGNGGGLSNRAKVILAASIAGAALIALLIVLIVLLDRRKKKKDEQ